MRDPVVLLRLANFFKFLDNNAQADRQLGPSLTDVSDMVFMLGKMYIYMMAYCPMMGLNAEVFQLPTFDCYKMIDFMNKLTFGDTPFVKYMMVQIDTFIRAYMFTSFYEFSFWSMFIHLMVFFTTKYFIPGVP